MPPLPNWQVFDRVRAFFRKTNIYRQDNLYQDQSDLSRIVNGTNFLELTRAAGLLDQTNLQINRLERYKDYDMMDEVGEMSLALDIYGDESSLMDPERKHSIVVRSSSKKVKHEVESLLYDTLLSDRDLRPTIRYLCKYGDFAAEIVPTKNRDGVSSLRFINVYNFTRVQTKFGDLVGFFYQDPNTLQPVFLHPWQVMHLRLTSFEQAYHPYGRSIIDGARKDFKRLRLMEDAALIYRITRAPEKRVFSIPVGNIPPTQVYQYITEIARGFKKHKFVDPATGQVNERWSPLIQEDDFFLPKRPGGDGPQIETLPGAQNLDQIEDILYFKKKMISGTKIPFSRVGIGEQSDNDTRSVSSVSPEFAKAVQWVQREALIGLKKVVVVHLALRGYSIEEIRDCDLSCTAASAIDELYRIETWKSRAEIIHTLKETELFPDEWILGRFTDMTDDEIAQMKSETKKSKQEGEVAPPPGAMPIGEAVNEEDKKLILEWNDYLKNGNNSTVNYKKNEDVQVSPSIEWYVNQNELDNLQPTGKPLLESVLDKSLIKEVKDDYKMVIETGSGEILDKGIKEIADSTPALPDEAVDSKTKLISEETSVQQK